MSTRRLLWILFVVLLVVGLSVSAVTAQGPRPGGRGLRGALGTEFTYQGRLTDGGSPANGVYDFQFKLYDAESLGTQIGGTVEKGDVGVSGGLFTTFLDFGASAFNGEARWLEIGVRPGASIDPYTPLTPRQPLTAVPYALYSMTAATVNYKNVVIVAKSGGNYSTITAALNSITDASDTNRYLVKVMPGVYSERVTMKQYVDIEGAGELTTKITYTGSATGGTGTAVGANNAELRFLTAESTSGADSTAIYNNSVSARFTHVTVTASGGTDNVGIVNSNSSSVMTNVTAIATGGTRSYAVYNGSSSPTMNNVTATAAGNSFSTGVYNVNSSPTMSYVTAIASGGAGSWNRGVHNRNSSPTIQNSIIRASGGATNNGIYNYSDGTASTVRINNSQVTGSFATIQQDTANYTTYVGAALLDGGAVLVVGGTVTCAGVYDENYVFYPSTCP